jgi:hypothetical protein
MIRLTVGRITVEVDVLRLAMAVAVIVQLPNPLA